MDTTSSLGARALTGLIWNVAATVLGKVFTFSTRIAVLWFLTTDEVGVATWALSLSQLVAVNGGMVVPALVQRGSNMEEMASEGFWLGLLLATCGGMFVLIGAPIAAYIYDAPSLLPLMAVLACGHIAFGLAPIGQARVSVRLRFRLEAGLNLLATVVGSAAMLVAAVAGAGAYALVVPLLAQAVAVTLTCNAFGLIPRPTRPSRAAMLQLAAPTGWIAAFGILAAARVGGMNLVLGGLRDASTTGIFVSGFGLAGQTVFLLAENLRRVLFPSLVSIENDIERQKNALMRLTRMLMLGVAIGCMIQAYAGPLLTPLLPARWAECGPVIFWLSAGLTTQPLSLVATSNFMSQKRNHELAGWTAFQTLANVAGIALGAVFSHDIAGVAIGAAAGLVIGNLVAFAASLWHMGVAERGLGAFLGRAPVVLLLMCLTGELLETPAQALSPVAGALMLALPLGVVALISTRLLAPADLREILQRTRLSTIARALRLQ